MIADVREAVARAAKDFRPEVGQVYEHIGALSYTPRWPGERLDASGSRIRIVQVAGEGRARTTRFVYLNKPAGGNGRVDRSDHAITHATLVRGYALVGHPAARSITCEGCGGETIYHEGGLCLACRSLPGTVVRAHKDDAPSSEGAPSVAASAPTRPSDPAGGETARFTTEEPR